jgi:hypothetical protein
MTGKGKIEWNLAVKYNPNPKKAAEPRETYFVRPEKKCQLIERAAHKKMFLKIDK